MLDWIVEVFCEVDDFCKAFLPHWEASLLGTGGPHVVQRDHHAAAHSSGFVTAQVPQERSGYTESADQRLRVRA